MKYEKDNKRFTFLLLAIPFVINASTYSREVSKANNYLERESFKNTYNKYILYGSSIPYNNENGELKIDSTFNMGGFISKSEFESSKVKNLSYLFDGTEYWTLTKDGSNVYAITYTDMDSPKSPSSSYSGRVTEYVKSGTSIKGSGTYADPWTFDPMFKVTVKTDNRYATINESENNVYVRGLCNQADCKASIGVEEKSGYRYITNNCGATYNTETKKIEISDVRRDIVCTVVFGTGNYKITLVGATPNTIYLRYGENYYSDPEGQTIIRKINSITQKRGYTYKGYQYNGYPVIDEDLNIVGGSVDKIYENAVINATYEPIKVPCGSGEYLKKNNMSCTTCLAGSYCPGGVYDYSETEDHGITECPSGYTSNSGTSNINQCYINVGDGKYIATVYSSTQTNCPAGTYKSAHQVNYGQTSLCDTCPSNTYSTGGSSSCISCPTGYNSATGSDAKSDCTINCNANYRVNTVDGVCNTACSTGYSHAAHTVSAGNTSSACTINSYTLTVNPNGGTWSGSTSNQTFTQNYNTTKTIENPSEGASYTISYNENGQGATYLASPTSVQRAFASWSLSGSGTLNGTTYTYGAGNGTLTASYNSTSNSFTLPTITKTNYTCKWAQGSASGTQYAGGASRTITANKTYYAVCTANPYTLTFFANDGIVGTNMSILFTPDGYYYNNLKSGGYCDPTEQGSWTKQPLSTEYKINSSSACSICSGKIVTLRKTINDATPGNGANADIGLCRNYISDDISSKSMWKSSNKNYRIYALLNARHTGSSGEQKFSIDFFNLTTGGDFYNSTTAMSGDFPTATTSWKTFMLAIWEDSLTKKTSAGTINFRIFYDLGPNSFNNTVEVKDATIYKCPSDDCTPNTLNRNIVYNTKTIVDYSTLKAVRAGYSLDGWYTAASGGQKIVNADGSLVASKSGYTDSNGKWIKAGNTNLYAHWN